MHRSESPQISVLVAVHNGARYLTAALRSLLRQSLDDLELIVVEDASTDETPAMLAEISDPRLFVLSNEQQLGLAGSLNRGLDHARGRYIARLDADDVAFPDFLQRVLGRLMREPTVVVSGAGVLEIDAEGRPGSRHLQPQGSRSVRWQALFGSPFFHNTVIIDRELLDRYQLRYDPAYLESEDYELWTRLLAHGDGDNVPEPLVLLRLHPEQATRRRHELQVSFQRKVALEQILELAPELGSTAELAWAVGSGRSPSEARDPRAATAFQALLDRFEARHGVDRGIRDLAARRLLRTGAPVSSVLRLAPTLPLRVSAERLPRRLSERKAGQQASRWLDRLAESEDEPMRVTVVSPEPTPYRSPLFDLVADRSEMELTVIYAAQTVAGRAWSVEPRHRSVFLRGLNLPGAGRLLHHDYPVTPAVARELRRSRPDVVVASGWSTFASQAAMLWARRNDVPYLLLVESHELGTRRGWRRLVKSVVVPRFVRGAAGALVLGTASRKSMLARGADPVRTRVFANTVDVPAWIARAENLTARRAELRGELGLSQSDVVVVSVARLGPEKGLDTLVEAVGRSGNPHLVLVLAGQGPERDSLARRAEEAGVRLLLLGNVSWERIAEVYAAGDAFALLSRRETWGVVVNEAAASGLPLLLSDQVGAAYDLLREGENGFRVPVDDTDAVAEALRTLASDAGIRRRFGERSREIVGEWGYESSAENFVAAVRDALRSR